LVPTSPTVAVMQSKPPSMSIWSTEMSMMTSAVCSARSELVQVPLVVLKVSLARGRGRGRGGEGAGRQLVGGRLLLVDAGEAQRLGAAAGHGLGLRTVMVGSSPAVPARLEEDDGAAGVALHRDVVGHRAGVGVEGDRDDARDERPLFEDVLIERHDRDSFVGWRRLATAVKWRWERPRGQAGRRNHDA
jgi:hypothetical protein